MLRPMNKILHVRGKSIPEAWEKSIVLLYELGEYYEGRYYKEGEEMGRNATIIMDIDDPCGSIRLHRGFTSTPEDLWAYKEEILRGSARPWEYTYHQRMRQWPINDVCGIDQLEYVLQCLCRKENSHKAVITLGNPRLDSVHAGNETHIPCLRELSFCIRNDYLMSSFFWRARNAVHASFNNLFGLSFLLEVIALELSVRLQKEIKVGPLTDISLFYHYNWNDVNYVKTLVNNSNRPDNLKYMTLEQFREDYLDA